MHLKLYPSNSVWISYDREFITLKDYFLDRKKIKVWYLNLSVYSFEIGDVDPDDSQEFVTLEKTVSKLNSSFNRNQLRINFPKIKIIFESLASRVQGFALFFKDKDSPEYQRILKELEHLSRLPSLDLFGGANDDD